MSGARKPERGPVQGPVGRALANAAPTVANVATVAGVPKCRQRDGNASDRAETGRGGTLVVPAIKKDLAVSS